MNRYLGIFTVLTAVIIMAGCTGRKGENESNMESMENANEVISVITDNKITELEKGLSAVTFTDDYGFDEFIIQGGASSDRDVIDFIKNNLIENTDISFDGDIFGCSTIAAQGTDGERLFGRNFDWNNCDALIVKAEPENGYASISTVNMDFIKAGTGFIINSLPDNIKTIAALYAPLDGMNEKGLCIAVNMIQDPDTIEQNSDKPDITTTTAIRLILDKAASTDEAVELLKTYDVHASMGMMIHFAISDAEGKSVAVEYVNNEMTVTDTPVLTNFYVSEGDKKGMGSDQSHERFEILEKALEDDLLMTEDKMKDTLDSVSKDNFNEFESTEWSIVFNQTTGDVNYYHRENYDKAYTFNLK